MTPCRSLSHFSFHFVHSFVHRESPDSHQTERGAGSPLLLAFAQETQGWGVHVPGSAFTVSPVSEMTGGRLTLRHIMCVLVLLRHNLFSYRGRWDMIGINYSAMKYFWIMDFQCTWNPLGQRSICVVWWIRRKDVRECQQLRVTVEGRSAVTEYNLLPETISQLVNKGSWGDCLSKFMRVGLR